MNLSHQLLEEYKQHYEFERDRLKRVQALQDEVQARATQIILEWIDFEILEAQEELDLFNANQKKYARNT